jgi:hypothetical protein
MKIWAMVGLVLLGAVVGGGAVALSVFRNVDARLLLADQPAEITILEPLEVTGRVLDNLDIEIDDVIPAAVPVDQILSLPITDVLDVVAEFDSEVPIRLDVRVRDVIPLDQTLDLDATIEADLLGDRHELPIRGKVPVKAEVPIDLTIPIDQMVRLKFRAPAKVQFREKLVVPLKTVIETEIPIRAALNVPVKSDLRAKVEFPKEPTSVVIDRSDLRLPLRTLVLEVADETEAEAR